MKTLSDAASLVGRDATKSAVDQVEQETRSEHEVVLGANKSGIVHATSYVAHTERDAEFTRIVSSKSKDRLTSSTASVPAPPIAPPAPVTSRELVVFNSYSQQHWNIPAIFVPTMPSTLTATSSLVQPTKVTVDPSKLVSSPDVLKKTSPPSLPLPSGEPSLTIAAPISKKKGSKNLNVKLHHPRSPGSLSQGKKDVITTANVAAISAAVSSATRSKTSDDVSKRTRRATSNTSLTVSPKKKESVVISKGLSSQTKESRINKANV